MSSSRRVAGWLGAAVVVLALSARPPVAEAQYFGRNKVQYHDFDFKVLKTRHFDIYYYPEEQPAIEQAGRLAERWYTRLSRVLGHQFAHRQAIVLYASHTHFEETNVLSGFIGEGTGGVTELFKRRVVLPLAGPLAETDHVLGHELVHAFQFDITGGSGPLSEGNVPNAVRLPLWFIEGMAEYLSLGPQDAHTAMWMRDAVIRDSEAKEFGRHQKLPTIKQLDNPEYFPYRWGQALWAYLTGRWGDGIVGDAMKMSTRGNDAVRILEELTGEPEKQLSEDWHNALRAAYLPVVQSKQKAAQIARALVTDKNGGEMNVGPSISPDGQRLAFLSEKDLYSIDLYLANGQTGEIRSKLVKTETDPHYQSLQFIYSAGGWDRTGTRFALGAVRAGKALLSIRGVDGAKNREVAFKEVDEILDPTWSPDGRQIAFSAQKGGLLDLYVYDLEAGRLRQLTNDAYADLQPAWSPDGRSIAFVTDRFSTRLENLQEGNYRLASLDPASGEVRALPSFDDVKNIDPQWSGDGRSLYFLSDRNGITNVYRLEVDSGRTYQVTDLATGVSGITSISPSLTVARNEVVFSVYEEGQNHIYSLTGDRMAGVPLVEPTGRLRAATLPPFDRPEGEVAGFESQPNVGLPEAKTFETKDYKPKLSLDYIGQPTLTVGADRFGGFAGGGVSFLWSDMLGDQSLGAVAQVQGSFQDFGAIVGYENRKHRWAWGGTLAQIPYLTGSFASGTTTIGGQTVLADQAELFRETDRAASGYVAYPFSQVQRVEVGLAARNISFGREIQTQYFDLAGNFLGQDKQKLDAPSGLTFGEATAALVYDSAVFGPTSPVLGRRYRFEVTPTFGQLHFTGVLGDVRQYFMPFRPVTLAGRLLHYGRYGGNSADDRLTQLFIGYPNLVRGYDVNSFDASECGNDPKTCPVFERLLGTRLAIANVEVRVPLFALFGAGRRMYGPLPAELVGFYDAGVAWTAQDKAKLLGGGGTRDVVSSVGYGLRINVLGFAVVEIDRVKPHDRPQKGWMWIFNFSPGF